VARILKEILSRGDFPEDTLFNVNLPPVHPSDVKGIRITSLGRRRYADGRYGAGAGRTARADDRATAGRSGDRNPVLNGGTL